jgi:hypothetical protein
MWSSLSGRRWHRQLVAIKMAGFARQDSQKLRPLIVAADDANLSRMEHQDYERLADAELHALFTRLFPRGFAGADVLAEVAPDGWERSPLLACFHPSVEQVFAESLQVHRNIAALQRARPDRAPTDLTTQSPEPTLEHVRLKYRPNPVKAQEELTELVGLALWDVFSDNHDVITADGRVADIGSFRGAGAFLDEHLSRIQDSACEGDYLRFYMGTALIGTRADLTPVYRMIFRRLQAIGADWIYHFPELHLVEFGPSDRDAEPSTYSVTESAVAELNAQRHRAETARLRTDVEEMNTSAREEAIDRPPPTTVTAYRQVYGRDPRGWPPA